MTKTGGHASTFVFFSVEFNKWYYRRFVQRHYKCCTMKAIATTIMVTICGKDWRPASTPGAYALLREIEMKGT